MVGIENPLLSPFPSVSNLAPGYESFPPLAGGLQQSFGLIANNEQNLLSTVNRDFGQLSQLFGEGAYPFGGVPALPAPVYCPPTVPQFPSFPTGSFCPPAFPQFPTSACLGQIPQLFGGAQQLLGTLQSLLSQLNGLGNSCPAPVSYSQPTVINSSPVINQAPVSTTP